VERQHRPSILGALLLGIEESRNRENFEIPSTCGRRLPWEAPVSTVEKATELLFLLSREGKPCALGQLSAELGAPKPSVHRLLHSLRYRNLVERDASGRYRLGVGVWALGLGACGPEIVTRAARPALEALAERLEETSFLVIEQAGELLVVSKAEGSGFLRASPQVGARVPAHATAVGYLFLAFAADRLAQAPLTRFTSKTAVTRPAVDARVERARALGYALGCDEWQDGLSAVAAPVFVFGRLLGAVALACASPRLQTLGEAAAARAVVHTAGEISKIMEGRVEQ
jgi:IclR family transcriptional regulator, acetate operon repressor